MQSVLLNRLSLIRDQIANMIPFTFYNCLVLQIILNVIFHSCTCNTYMYRVYYICTFMHVNIFLFNFLSTS